MWCTFSSWRPLSAVERNSQLFCATHIGIDVRCPVHKPYVYESPCRIQRGGQKKSHVRNRIRTRREPNAQPKRVHNVWNQNCRLLHVPHCSHAFCTWILFVQTQVFIILCRVMMRCERWYATHGKYVAANVGRNEDMDFFLFTCACDRKRVWYGGLSQHDFVCVSCRIGTKCVNIFATVWSRYMRNVQCDGCILVLLFVFDEPTVWRVCWCRIIIWWWRARCI